MKILLPFLLLGLLAFTARAADPDDQLPPPPQGKSFKLVWHDEFDGDKLDETRWAYRPDGKRKGGWWSRKAISLDGDGHLVITTFMDGDKPTDGCITTQGKFEHAFGYYLARVKLQKEPGHWSAFWITGPGVGKVGDDGRDGTEIDIMEKPWLDDRVQHAFHWDGYGKDHKSEGKVVKVPGGSKGSCPASGRYCDLHAPRDSGDFVGQVIARDVTFQFFLPARGRSQGGFEGTEHIR